MYPARLCLLCWSLLLISLNAMAGPATALLLDPQVADRQLVGAEHLRYRITGDQTGWRDLLDDSNTAAWQVPSSDTLNLQAGRDTVWVHLPLRNASGRDGEWVLEIRWPLIVNVEARQISAGRVISSAQAGLAVSTSNGQKNLVIPLRLKAGEQSSLYLRVRDPHLVHLPTMVWTKDAYEIHADHQLVFFSLVLGALLALTFYNAALYTYTRDRMFVFYSNAMLSTSLYVLASTGYGRLYLWGGVPWLEAHAYPLAVGYCFLAVTWFFRVFLSLPEYRGWVLHANTVFVVIWAAVLLASFAGFGPAAMMIAGPAGIGVTLVGTITAVYLWSKGSRPAKFFCLAWGAVSAGTICSISVLMGVIEWFPAVEYLQPATFVLEGVLLSIALGDRINHDRQAREQAQALALERQAAMLQMQEQTNAELEERVQARTTELTAALTDLEQANGELARLSKTDPLTRVHNRRHFDEIAAREAANAVRLGRPLAVMVVDLDHFKQINDTHGHAAGDRCLQLAAEAISATASRPGDVVARVGGEEFAVILPNTDLASAASVAERVRSAIEDISVIHGGATMQFTASIGVAGASRMRGDGLHDLMDAADKALYEAKGGGRNCVRRGVAAEARLAT